MPKLQTIVQNAATTLAVLLVTAALGREVMVLTDYDFDTDTAADMLDARPAPPPTIIHPTQTPTPAPIARD
jgi:hypothetical protein